MIEPYNNMFVKGYKMSEEHKRKIGVANKLRMKKLWKNPEYKKHMSNVHKGQISPMKGKQHTAETKEKIRIAHLGNTNASGIRTQEQRERISQGKLLVAKRGDKHPDWKGDNIGYVRLHSWVREQRGTPETCEHCHRTGLKGQKIHWASRSRKYKRDSSDWLRLCVPCHYTYDRRVTLITLDD